MKSLERAALDATFNCFANCYLKEVDGGKFVWLSNETVDEHYIEWQLLSQQVSIRAEVTYISVCGPHAFGEIQWKQTLSVSENHFQWCLLDPLLATHMLLKEAYSRKGGGATYAQQVELLSGVLDSCQNMMRFAHVSHHAKSENLNFIDAEQSLIFGHWQHPTPKNQNGFTSKGQELYAPEFHNHFQLDYFIAKRSIVDEMSSLDRTASQLLVDACQTAFELDDDECLVPQHPLQSTILLNRADVQAMIANGTLRHVGRGGRFFSATSSMRTLYCEDSDWMLKFSLPIRLTNSVRLNLMEELEAGVAMSRLLSKEQILEDGSRLQIIDDPAFLTVKSKGKRESGFEVIIRRNPFKRGQEQRIVQIASLTAEPLPGEKSQLHRVIDEIAVREGVEADVAAKRWFVAYLSSAFVPLVKLYDRFGIAFEAHQQNCLIDVSRGYPCNAYLRDNQGYYLSKGYSDLLSRSVPTSIGSLFYNDEVTRDRLSYYLVVNQVFSVINRIGRDHLCDERELLYILQVELCELHRVLKSAGLDFVSHLLNSPTLSSKLNLTTRLVCVDELENRESIAFYHDIANPIATIAREVELPSRRPHAVAS